MMRRVFVSLGFLAVAMFNGACWNSVPAPPPVQVEVVEAPAEATPVPVLDITSITDPDVALAEGNRLLDENLTQKAIDAYKHAISLNPDLADAHFQLGLAYDLLEMQNEQQGVLTETPAANAKDKKKKTESEKSFEKAVAAYEKRIDKNSKDHSAYFSLGRTYVKLLKDEDAEKAFKQAVKLNPDDTEYQTELGSILIVLAQYAEAIGPLKKALELDPANARADEMLEDAQAGRQRIDYISKNTNQPANKPARTPARTASKANSNSATVPPASNTRPREVPSRTPRSANRP